MKGIFKTLAIVAGVAGFGSANAITFSNVQVDGDAVLIGTIGVDTIITTGASDLDVVFKLACVGDGQAVRQGVINVTFEVSDVLPINCDFLTLDFTGCLSGSGQVVFQEIIEDRDLTTNVLLTYGKTFFPPTTVYTELLDFSPGSKKIKVKKTFFLIAEPDVPGVVDLAGIRRMNQNFTCVPEPASMAALGLGAAALIRRRRKA